MERSILLFLVMLYIAVASQFFSKSSNQVPNVALDLRGGDGVNVERRPSRIRRRHATDKVSSNTQIGSSSSLSNEGSIADLGSTMSPLTPLSSVNAEDDFLIEGSVEKDPLLKPDPGRFALFPIKKSTMWSMYKQHVASFWTVEEVDLQQDKTDFVQKLNDDERRFVTMVLAFFAGADGIVMENLAQRFCVEVQAPEARAFYSFQIAMESIHQEMYSLLIDALVESPVERHALFHAHENHPVIAKKAQWALRWVNSNASFAQRVVAMACVEGIFFSGSFCAVFWLKKRGLMPGLCFSNELISRDEGLHCDFACGMYAELEHRLSDATVHAMVDASVVVEKAFVNDALQVSLIGMNAELMGAYVEFCADRLLTALGHPKLYHATNPFPWMDLISMEGKTNFFEKRVGEYQKAGVMSKDSATADRTSLNLDADF